MDNDRGSIPTLRFKSPTPLPSLEVSEGAAVAAENEKKSCAAVVVGEVGEAAGAESVADQVVKSKENVAASNKKIDESQLHEGQKAKKKKKKKRKRKDEEEVKEEQVKKQRLPVDIEKQCGVLLPNGRSCARSLSCKSHSIGAKRAVSGRSKPYDVLLASYRSKTAVQNPTSYLPHPPTEAAGAPAPEEVEANITPGDI